MKRTLAKALVRALKVLGYRVTAFPAKKTARPIGLNLNIGAGNYLLDGFRSLDVYTPHYYKNREAFDASRVEYDMRKDAIPFSSGTVDNIYVNHVIEHIETEHVERFFAEAYRVLRPSGVLRVGCPDAEFIYHVSSFKNDYWNWRRGWFKKNTNQDTGGIGQFDAMISMLATRRMRGYKQAVTSLEVSEEDAKGMKYTELMQRLRKGLVFEETHPGEHINNWDLSRISSLANRTGFAHAIPSKPHGSIAAQMQGPEFDANHNHMSLYIDIVK